MFDSPLIAEFTSFLVPVLTPARLRHSLGVMHTMADLARVYGLDLESAVVTGLLHDAAKDLPVELQEQIIAEAGIEILEDSDRDYNLYLHGPVGAALVRRELGICDPLILDAIRTHTFYGGGENFHAPLTWCLRFSDILEPFRNWSKVPQLRETHVRLRELVFCGRMREAALLQTASLQEWFGEVGYPVHPNMQRALIELRSA